MNISFSGSCNMGHVTDEQISNRAPFCSPAINNVARNAILAVAKDMKEKVFDKILL